MTIAPYNQPYRSHKATETNNKSLWSKTLRNGSLILIACSVLFAFQSPPNRPESNRSLSVEASRKSNPADYFKDQPEEYYQALLKRERVPRILQERDPFTEPENFSPEPPRLVDDRDPFIEARTIDQSQQQLSDLSIERNGDLVTVVDETDEERLVEENTDAPSASPSSVPSGTPTVVASGFPTVTASDAPTDSPSDSPSSMPSSNPTIGTTSGKRVFAFYVQRDNNLPENDEALQSSWIQAWETAGYEPTILTVGDAQLHPDYANYVDAIESVLISSAVKKPLELIPCYLRYLALAVQGGGTLVDLDMTPRHLSPDVSLQTLDDGKMITYCNVATETSSSNDWLAQVETQNGLPCAVHADSGEEWLRVGKLMGWVANQFLDQPIWSDAHALQFLTTLDEVHMAKQEVAQSWRTSGWDRCHVRYV